MKHKDRATLTLKALVRDDIVADKDGPARILAADFEAVEYETNRRHSLRSCISCRWIKRGFFGTTCKRPRTNVSFVGIGFCCNKHEAKE